MTGVRNLQQCVQRGNVVRDQEWLQQGLAFVPCYVANGAFGGSVDEFGFHSRPNHDIDHGRTHLAHVEHFGKRHDNGGHVLRGLAHLTARNAQGEAPGLGLLDHWRQELDLWTATCTTEWTRGSSYRTEVFASWATPQLWCFRLDQTLVREDDALCLALNFDVRNAENSGKRADDDDAKHMRKLELSIEPCGDSLWRVRSVTDCCTTEVLLNIDAAKVTPDDGCLRIQTAAGKTEIRVLVLEKSLAEDIRQHPENFLRRTDHRDVHTAAVQHFWETSGMLDLPAETPEASWWPRYVYYLPASLSPTPSHIQVTTGLNANIWGHGFPQDQWYVMMPLPRLGLHDLTAAQLPYYNDNLDAWKRYTKRLCKRDGAFFAWEAPFENIDEFERDGPTNVNAYQFHNAGYVLAMIWESYLVHRDDEFLRRHAELIENVARFFVANTDLPETAQAVLRNDDIPLRSQDEMTAHGAETVQPLCSVWSSLYTFDAYLRMCEVLGKCDPECKQRVEAIVQRGYDFSNLVREDGTLRTSATDPRPLGQQKHPPQLNPLTYVPMAEWMTFAPVRTSWEHRHDLCRDSRRPKSFGWTFGQYTLASARMHDGAAVQDDLSLVKPARFCDPDWIQFYESSCIHGWSHKKSYYFTVMGLYVMAMADTVIQDYRDGIDVLPALLPRWEGKPVGFTNMHLRGGLVADGRYEDGKLSMTLRAERNSETTIRVHPQGNYELILNGESKSFAAGEAVPLQLQTGRTVEIRSAG